MWILLLNDMRFPKIEMRQAVARAPTREDLVAWIEREKVEGYREPRDQHRHWGKSFRKGGLLEWYNSPYEFQFDDHFVDFDVMLAEYCHEHGLSPWSEAVTEIRRKYMELPDASQISVVDVPEVSRG